MTRQIIAVSQMLWSAFLIHLTEGRIETHFHVFGSLAFFAFYKDWRVIATATVVVSADHAFAASTCLCRDTAFQRRPGGDFWNTPAGWFSRMWSSFCRSGRALPKCSGAMHQAEIEESRTHVEHTIREGTAELNSLYEVLQATAAEARQSEEKFRHILTAAADAIISVDNIGTIIELSRAAEEMFGYTRGELIGSPATAIVPKRSGCTARHGIESLPGHRRTTSARVGMPRGSPA